MIALLLAAQLLVAGMPNPAVTPGVVRPLSLKTICTTRWGKDARHVTDEMKQHVAEAYGIDEADWHLYEFDHLIPRSLGGDDKEGNLWPQLWIYAHQKDVLEVRLGKLVCNHTISLRMAQNAIKDDWQAAGRRWPRTARRPLRPLLIEKPL